MRRILGLVFSAATLAALPACSVSVSSVSSEGTTGGTTGAPPPPAEGAAYPGKGFVVHEWGTDTVVVGSDGSLQRGLHHEEEDLPAFVYDRVKAGALPGNPSVEVKMETPVTYFYSDVPRTVNVQVDFPKGVFTQWYPAVDSFYPHVADTYENGTTQIDDPVFDLGFPFHSPECVAHYAAVADGNLDWGAVDVLARDATPDLPAASLDAYTWSYARQVGANPVRITGAPGASGDGQDEKFLFYRGLGNFPLPVTVTAPSAQEVHVQNGYDAAIGRVFVIHVDQGVGAFDVHTEGVAPGATLSATVPSAYGLGIDDFAEALGKEVASALDATGLYHDEAVAMVSTWKRQWFRTPGIRLLYVMPQAWTEASIPLGVTPAPDQTVRVMVIRTEVITPEMEADDEDYAQMLGQPDGDMSAQIHFQDLGRFAEPRLRRALDLLGNPAAAQPFLASIATAETRQSTGE